MLMFQLLKSSISIIVLIDKEFVNASEKCDDETIISDLFEERSRSVEMRRIDERRDD